MGFMNQCADKFRQVSLFQWYKPKDLSDDNPAAFSKMPKPSLTKRLLARGMNFSLRKKSRQMEQTCINQYDVIPSCDIHTPLRVELLCLQDVVTAIHRHFTS